MAGPGFIKPNPDAGEAGQGKGLGVELKQEGDISYRLRRSDRARRLRITVRPGGVEVVVPSRAREAEIAAFVERHRAWVLEKWRAVECALAAHPGHGGLVDGAQVLLRGVPVPLAIRPGPCARAGVTRAGPGLRVVVPLRASDDLIVVENALRGWLRKEAQADAQRYAERHGPRNGLVPDAIRIKHQQSLWGSCTARGLINLNWRLIFAPPPVFEYVVVHELCHLRVRNHQREFWRLVAALLPDFARHRRWLKANGHLLTLKPGEPG